METNNKKHTITPYKDNQHFPLEEYIAKRNKKLEMPIQYLKGVGPRLASVFSKRRINTLRDCIHWYPRTYKNQQVIHSISQIEPNTHIILYGYIFRKKSFTLATKERIYEIIIKLKNSYITCKYFRLPYRGYFDNLEIDQKVKVSGQAIYYKGYPELHHPDIYPFKEEEEVDALLPVYTEIEKISQNKIKKMMSQALKILTEDDNFSKTDLLPEWLRKEAKLIHQRESLIKIHQPDQKQANDYLQFRSPAQIRLIFEEFFFLQLYMCIKKLGLKKEDTHPIPTYSTLIEKLKLSLNFTLTHAQEKALTEITQDMNKNHPMHRLVQGDVGCGKTIVALLASCPAIEHGFQSAIMAPTEILAEQHYKKALSLLKPLGINVSLLTGKLRAKEKRNILEKLASGYTSLCIGTQALIQETVQFNKLAFVIIDEQHRFGVHQRGLLKEKGIHPHFLVMTATPIPRSLAMTLYGDLDVSIIDEMPKGRKPVITKKTYSSQREQVWSFLESQIKEGRQAYIVYPLVEESEKIDLKNAIEEYENLQKRFPHLSIGLLHGKMPTFEKQEIMSSFVAGTIQILVSTTVIEVGVDVANASLMVVEHADRFGLSQLHQLRGRVGRGKYKSYCILILSKGHSKEAFFRLSIMEKTSDGFKIAEEDLEIRGPGEFLGTRQSGLPEFNAANIVRDGKILKQAKHFAIKLIEKDPMLNWPEHQILKTEIKRLSDRFLPG